MTKPHAGRRAETAASVASLKEEGLNGIQIADRLGISRSYAYELLNDPDGVVVRQRKASYAGSCIDCGAPTDGSNGPRGRPTRCAECAARHQHETREWTRERIIEAVLEWARLFGEPPSATNWNPNMPGHLGSAERQRRWAVHDGHWPHVYMVQREFGTWNRMIEAAGFTPRAARAKSPHGSLTREDYEATERLVRERGTHEAARQLGMTVSGVYRRLRHLKFLRGEVPSLYQHQMSQAKERRMPQYAAVTAIDKDIEKNKERIKVLEAEVAERRAYLEALKAAKGALDASRNGTP